jgi:addiction module HigA family antidote
VEINYIIKGTKDINADFAIRFGIAFGTSAEVWSNLQEKYDLYKASQSEKKNEYFIIENKIKELAIA